MNSRRFVHAALAVVLCSLVVACSSRTRTRPLSSEVRVDGGALAASETRYRAEFLAKLGGHPADAVLRRLVVQNPDLTLDLLRGSQPLETSLRERIVGAYLGIGDETVEGGDVRAAFVRVEAVRLQESPVMAAELAREAGLSHLELDCLVAGFETDVFDPSLRPAAFSRAVVLAERCRDPNAWRRLLSGPLDRWPAGEDLPSPAQAWALAASWALERGDPWTAFLDWRRARGLHPGHGDAAHWRLGEARALFELGRYAETAMTAAPLRGEASFIARPAEALLGAVEARLDHLATAVAHLERALEGDESWPGAGRAMADLATTQMLAGRDAAALDLLTRAGERLEADEDWVGLATLLANERAWADHRGVDELSKAAAARLAALESEHGIVID